MPTLYEYARVSKAAYENSPLTLGPDWTPWPDPNLNEHGYFGIAYINERRHEIIIGHRGTDETLLENIRADGQLFLGQIPDAWVCAKAFSQAIRDFADSQTTPFKIFETGHSLGGVYAAINACYFGQETNTYAITFDNPGIASLLQDIHISYQPKTTKLINILSAPNIINAHGAQLGRCFRLYTHHVMKESITVGGLHDLSHILLSLGAPNIAKILSNFNDLRGKIIERAFHYIKWIHSLDNIIASINPASGEPYLIREIIQWPSLLQVISFFPQFWLLLNPHNGSTTTRNYEMEKRICSMPGYEVGAWVSLPSAKAFSCEQLALFNHLALKRYDQFFGASQPELRQLLLKKLYQETIKQKKKKSACLPLFFNQDGYKKSRLLSLAALFLAKFKEETLALEMTVSNLQGSLICLV